ncbi:hypothetical protein KI387_030932, partial [Taxus chinensis]
FLVPSHLNSSVDSTAMVEEENSVGVADEDEMEYENVVDETTEDGMEFSSDAASDTASDVVLEEPTDCAAKYEAVINTTEILHSVLEKINRTFTI